MTPESQKEIERRTSQRIGYKGDCTKTNELNRLQGEESERVMAILTESDPQPGSGCGRIHKEDLKNKHTLIQDKSSRGDTISVKIADLEALVQNARRLDKEPVMTLNFTRKQAVQAPRIWALVPIEKWQTIKYDEEK